LIGTLVDARYEVLETWAKAVWVPCTACATRSFNVASR